LIHFIRTRGTGVHDTGFEGGDKGLGGAQAVDVIFETVCGRDALFEAIFEALISVEAAGLAMEEVGKVWFGDD